jgi:hypothetical protein
MAVLQPQPDHLPGKEQEPARMKYSTQGRLSTRGFEEGATAGGLRRKSLVRSVFRIFARTHARCGSIASFGGGLATSRSRPMGRHRFPQPALFLFEAGALHDLLPHRNFADHARMQVFGTLIFHHEAGVEHLGPDVGLLQDDLGFLG